MQDKHPSKLPNSSIVIDLTEESIGPSSFPKKHLAELKKEENPQEKKSRLSNELSGNLTSPKINNSLLFGFVPVDKPNKAILSPSLFFSKKINDPMKLQELGNLEEPLNASISQDIVRLEPTTVNSSIKLSIELVPDTCWFKNVRTEVSKNNWKKLQKATLEKANYHCEICEISNSTQLDCHEIWHYDDQGKVQRLLGLIALCKGCHDVKHIGLATQNFRRNNAKMHLAKVNGWDLDQAEAYIKSCFSTWRERSRHQWKLDISWIEKQGIEIKKQVAEKSDIEWEALFTKKSIREINQMLDQLLPPDITKLQSKTKQETTCLHSAVSLGNIEILTKLLTFPTIKALMNEVDKKGETPLNLAIRMQNVEIVEILCQHHADIKKVARLKKNALHYAVEKKNVEIVKLILSQGGEQLCHQYNSLNQLPIHSAFNVRRETLAKGLIENEKILAVATLLLPHLQESEVISVDSHGKTILHLAVGFLSKSQFESLLKAGGVKILSLSDKYGKTILHEAAKWGNIDAVKLILAYGGQSFIDQCDNYGKSPLHEAAMWCHCSVRATEIMDIIHILLKQGARWDRKSIKGNETAFEAMRERLGIVKTMAILSPYLTPDEVKAYKESAKKLETDDKFLSEKLFPITYLGKRKLRSSSNNNLILPGSFKEGSAQTQDKIRGQQTKELEDARQYYAQEKKDLYQKGTTNALKFFQLAKDKCTDVQGVDRKTQKEIEKRIIKLNDPDGKYLPMKLNK